MHLVGKTIDLVGLSHKGKNRLRENGTSWTVLAETEKVLFNPAPGPWLFIVPSGRDKDDRASRWIKKDNDQDFMITSVT